MRHTANTAIGSGLRGSHVALMACGPGAPPRFGQPWFQNARTGRQRHGRTRVVLQADHQRAQSRHGGPELRPMQSCLRGGCLTSYGFGVTTSSPHRCTDLPSIVIPECLPPAAGVATTLCCPDGTLTLLRHSGQVSVYMRGTVSTRARLPAGQPTHRVPIGSYRPVTARHRVVRLPPGSRRGSRLHPR